MLTISALAIYIPCAVFLAAHFAVAFFVPERRRRLEKRTAPAPQPADWGTQAEHEAAQAWWAERCARLDAEAKLAADRPLDLAA